jgi:steroid delta-isomerase-like uncharacterized protein
MNNHPRVFFCATMTLSCILVLAACSRQPAAQQTAEDNKALLQRYADAMNRGNEAFVEEYFASTAVYHGPMGDLSRDEFIQSHKAMLAAFPDLQLTIEDQVAEGDRVVTRWTARGTHEGDFQGIAPTGTEVVITGIVISRIEGGKEVEAWEELNLLGLMQQLGALPATGEN